MQIPPSEREWLLRVLADPTNGPLRLQYAENLAAQGEAGRAEVVRSTAQVLAESSPTSLPRQLDGLLESHGEWLHLVGASLVAEMESRDLTPYAERWLRVARPAVSMQCTPCVVEPTVGSTFWGGDPDLPDDDSWPVYSECSREFGNIPELDPASECQFVGQINLADLAATAAGHGLPEGLLSIFAFSEYDSFGISEVTVRVSRDVGRLRRRRHPNLTEANQRQPLRRVEMKEVLTIPDTYDGPWSDDPELEEGPLSSEDHRPVLEESRGGRFGMFGHLRGTTGGDPTPSREWQRFFCVPVDAEAVIWHHVAITDSDLAAARLNEWRAVWTDMDG